MKEEKRMLEMLNKMWIGATCRLHNFVEDFKHEEKGAAEIVAIILVIVVKDISFLEIGNLKTLL